LLLEFAMIVLQEQSILDERRLLPGVRRRLEQDYLPAYVAQRRWFAGKDQSLPRVKITHVFPTSETGPVLMIIQTLGGRTQSYFLPIGIKQTPAKPANCIGEIRLGSHSGYLIDAFEDDDLLQEMVSNLERATDEGGDIELGVFLQRSAGFPSVDQRHIKRLGAEQSNSSVRFGNAILKAYRKLEPGIQPELELGRFLSRNGRYNNAPKVLGSLETRGTKPITLWLFQELIENNGDAWEVTCKLLEQLNKDPAGARSQIIRLADRLGDRTARLHNALGSGAESGFSADPILDSDIQGWVHDICLSATSVLDQLAAHPSPVCRRLVARRDEVVAEIRRLGAAPVLGKKIRLHGDLHLGQVLVTTDDVFIIDFEGEPLRPFEQRRSKYSPMKDVAGLLRSFDYARATVQKQSGTTAAADIAETVDDAKSALLHSYFSQSGLAGDLAEARALLRIFLYEKTFYEIRYELANRPDWIDIPVGDAIAPLEAHELYAVERALA
jgi:trehalose synthase-fused probable maltokinase